MLCHDDLDQYAEVSRGITINLFNYIVLSYHFLDAVLLLISELLPKNILIQKS